MGVGKANIFSFLLGLFYIKGNDRILLNTLSCIELPRLPDIRAIIFFYFNKLFYGRQVNIVLNKENH